MSTRPVDEYCPECGEIMPAMLANVSPLAPDANEYDHYWCDHCDMTYDIDEFNQGEDAMSNKQEGIGGA